MSAFGKSKRLGASGFLHGQYILWLDCLCFIFPSSTINKCQLFVHLNLLSLNISALSHIPINVNTEGVQVQVFMVLIKLTVLIGCYR